MKSTTLRWVGITAAVLCILTPQTTALAAGGGHCQKDDHGVVTCEGSVSLPPSPGGGNPGGGGHSGAGGISGGGVIGSGSGAGFVSPGPVGAGAGGTNGGGPAKPPPGLVAQAGQLSFCVGIGGCPAAPPPPPPAPPAGPGPAAPPPPPPPSPAEVAQIAYAKITLAKPTIGSAPCTRADCKGAVGLPVWLWTDPRNWTPQTASASLGGVTVNVNAKPRAVTWSMGDGSKVTCTTPGTKYHTSMGFNSSPDCGYKYLRTSLKQPGGRYTVQAVASYDVVFSGAFKATLNPTTSSTTTVAITEYQAIVER